MKHRVSTITILFVAFLWQVCARAADGPPNVVLILSDDQSWTDYGFMGHPAIETPHLDQLAKQSATFRRGYVPTALCRPSLATILTGRFSHENLITGNDPADTPENRQHAARSGKTARELLISNIDRHPTVPRLLAEIGYLSFQSGKWWEGSFLRGGFTHGMTRGYPRKGGRHGDDGLKIGRKGMHPVNNFIDMAVEQKKPFFLWYAPFLPHTPHNPPARLLEKYQEDVRPLPVARYYAMCEWFDETCGQLLDKLEAEGIADNTLVVYVTDNGWIQRPDSGSYAPRSKRSPYEGGTRTPIMFRWPGKIKAAERPELCSSIDIVPTILAAAGKEAPADLPGLNLLPELKSGAPIERDTIFGESFAHDIADIQNPQASLLYRWVIRGHDKLLLTYDGRPGRMKYPPVGREPQLFDLKNDPTEKTNLASKHTERVEALTKLLDDWYPVKGREVAGARTVDPSQSEWYQKYSKQKNAPKPAAMLLNKDKEPELGTGFIELFSGKDLEGWTPKGGEATFEAKDGVIVGTTVPGTPSTYLCTEKADFTNFVFTCDVKWEVNLNSGVMFRAATRRKGEKEEVFGPQAEMEGIEGDRGWSGGVYGQSCGGYFYPLWLKEHQAARKAIVPKGWNRLTIQAKGNVVKTWVNGIPAAHWIGDGTYSKGFFGLQVHKAKAGKVLFRNLRVKELQEHPSKRYEERDTHERLCSSRS